MGVFRMRDMGALRARPRNAGEGCRADWKNRVFSAILGFWSIFHDLERISLKNSEFPGWLPPPPPPSPAAPGRIWMYVTRIRPRMVPGEAGEGGGGVAATYLATGRPRLGPGNSLFFKGKSL